ncbi:UDP-galactose 4-epimerase [Planomicrobium soli]|uniref:UDP-glucose 4-epimerase n=1 Tax=Planomicrobium soli TaxID=1176648 RepID=A0A2P8H3B2_9BACL|nr:UDP-glucose 4-epimerase GalE [Planomicrobium soli]PSL40705.1 UDP-galactose 4-epimerase [Planomicrobium soli]
MKILVTGGAGYIGSHAILELLENDYEIIVVDNLSNSKIESINRVKAMTGKEFPFYQVDLLDAESLNEIFSKHEIDGVMHFAGMKSVGESIAEPIKYYYNNIMGTVNLCNIMNKFNVKKLVFSSSATVYGKPQSVPITESFPLSATNPYGRTKLVIEEFLQELTSSDCSWRIAILRYFNPIGAHESGEIGEFPNGIPNNLMPYITQVGIGKREKLYIFGDDYNTTDGTGVRDYIHVVDLVKGHLKALNYLKNYRGIEAFNLGSGVGHSVLELVNSFSEVNNVNIPFQIEGRRPGDVSISYADPSKARNLLGWKSTKNLKDMCKDSWNWQIKNPNGF